MTKPKNFKTIIIGVITLAVTLALIGTVIIMRQLGTRPVAPTAPESQPAAAPSNICTTSFTVSALDCNQPCTADTQCGSGMACDDTSGRCRNPQNPTSPTCQPSQETTYACNSTCQTDAQCQTANANFTCSSGKCRLGTNPTSPTCQPPASYACNDQCQTDQQCQSENPDHICYDSGTTKTCRQKDNPTSPTCQPPEGVYACDSACQTDTQCQTADTGYVCSQGKCRLGANPASTSCGLFACNQGPCTADNQCGTDMVCDSTSDTCRNPQNPTSPTCSPPVGGPESHLECIDNACQSVLGGGDNLCNSNQDCQPDTHLACVNQACQVVQGSGSNSCSSDAQCQTQTHLACVNQACQSVSGAGANTCASNPDCQTPQTSPTPTPALPQAGSSIPTMAIFAAGGLLVILGALALLF